MNECAKSTFTGVHLWEIQDKDEVVCRFCRLPAPEASRVRTLEQRDYLAKTNRLAGGLRTMSQEMRDISKKRKPK